MALPDISLRAFNKIATGKYNAGLIDFATDEDGKITLTKVNNHIKKVKLNKVKLSPERILEVKETFINALQKGGVTNEDLAEIRKKLGIPETIDSDSSIDAQAEILRQRFCPLTRQDVRDILDKYANSGRGIGAAERPLSFEDVYAQVKTLQMPAKRKEAAQKTTEMAVKIGTSYDYSIAHTLAFLTNVSITSLNKARLHGIKGEDAENRKQASSDALRNQFTMVFEAAVKLLDENVQNEAGGLTTDPYRNKTADQIKAELKAKSLNDIMDSATTDASVPGQVGFFKQVLSDYFLQMSNADPWPR